MKSIKNLLLAAMLFLGAGQICASESPIVTALAGLADCAERIWDTKTGKVLYAAGAVVAGWKLYKTYSKLKRWYALSAEEKQRLKERRAFDKKMQALASEWKIYCENLCVKNTEKNTIYEELAAKFETLETQPERDLVKRMVAGSFTDTQNDDVRRWILVIDRILHDSVLRQNAANRTSLPVRITEDLRMVDLEEMLPNQ